MAKKFEVVRPKSLTNSDYEEFEYLIRWVGRDGADYLYLFYDARIRRRIRSNIVNLDDSDLIESLISSSEKTIKLFADDLSKNDLLVMQSMLENKYVTRLKKDGTTERFAVSENSFDYRLMDGRYELEIELRAPNNKVWN